ncbi:MAG: site-specific integrase, partial [Treponema sp.]|nr:site-specific integrase [Treponema sp.]
MRRFYLYERRGIFYAALINQETGKPLPGKSTGKRDRDSALLVIADWLKNGIPQGKGSRPRFIEHIADFKALMKAVRSADLSADEALAIAEALKARGLLDMGITMAGPGRHELVPFLLDFWDFDKSAYIRDKLVHGHRITRRYCHEAALIITRHWKPRFTNRALNTVTRQDLREFSLALHEGGKAAKTINNILLMGTTAIKFAFTEGMIPADVTTGLTRFTGGETRRDVLTEAETGSLFAVKWNDGRAYAGALLAATAGLRSGEVRAIRRSDIGELILNVAHSFSDFDGLKTPKNGEARRVPLLSEVRGLLMELLAENPHADVEDPYVFYSDSPDKPISGELLRRGLLRALKAACIDTAGRKVDFHSFRHYYASRMADRMTAEKVARITGHKSKAMAEHYQSHVTDMVIAEAGRESEEAFSGILQFKKRA